MTEFIKRFIDKGNYSFVGMRDTAISLLPDSKSEIDALYEELNRGRDVLENEDLLNVYLYSYGKMHKFKLVKAIFNLLEQVCLHNEELEIYDWGCGQGLATVCFLDCLSYCEIKPIINNIYLIDQSSAATNRASSVISRINPYCCIKSIIKNLNNLSPKDFHISNVKKIHFFSNILDVDSVDLFQFARVFLKITCGENYIVGVGPCYNRERVNEFFEYIEPDTYYNSVDYERGEWINDWSISLRVCKLSRPCIPTFKPLLIQKERFPEMDISLSTIRQAEDSDGKLFNYYWLTINGMICLTGSNFTKLLGKDADDKKAYDTLIAHEGEFQIVQAVDEDGSAIFINDDFERPLLKIAAVPHSVKLLW